MSTPRVPWPHSAETLSTARAPAVGSKKSPGRASIAAAKVFFIDV
jgi:hypothetical protein